MDDLPSYDLCVIGGGINGAGIARDAAGRGLSVLLVEQNDLASGTSSASSKLIHGGLRYLEYYEFRMVREALRERERLMRIAPHLISPMEFLLPYVPDKRPYFLIRLGLFLYDRLAKRVFLNKTRVLNLQKHIYGDRLQNPAKTGFLYDDCWADDARLVVLNTIDARERGAEILTRTRCTGLRNHDTGWTVSLQDTRSSKIRNVQVSMVINAAGPWVGKFLGEAGIASPNHPAPHVRLVKGSHIIIKRPEGWPLPSYVLQQADKRIVFVIPYEEEYYLIGTTEEDYDGDPGEAVISEGEKRYLCQAYNEAFSHQISQDDIVHSYSGVRPLFDDGGENASAVTRDYRLHHHTEFSAPMISIYGGKLTTYRVVAQEAVSKILKIAGRKAGKGWTDQALLPGADFPHGDFDGYVHDQTMKYRWLPEDLTARYARLYGTRMELFLDGKTRIEDLGTHWGSGLYDAEVQYLSQHEWAMNSDDILWRRTKLGLHLKGVHDGKRLAFGD